MPRVSEDIYMSRVAAQMLHGGGSRWNSGNRWFDKTLQVSADLKRFWIDESELLPETERGQAIQDTFCRKASLALSGETEEISCRSWQCEILQFPLLSTQLASGTLHFFYCLCPRLLSVAVLCVPCKSIFCLRWTMPCLLGGSPNIGRSVSFIFPRLVTFPVSARSCPGFFLLLFPLPPQHQLPSHSILLVNSPFNQEHSWAAAICASPLLVHLSWLTDQSCGSLKDCHLCWGLHVFRYFVPIWNSSLMG